jgi:hypothetical protein
MPGACRDYTDLWWTFPPFSDGENMLLVPPDQPSVLARALRRVNADAELRQHLAAGAAELRAEFDWERIARACAAHYAQVAQARPRGDPLNLNAASPRRPFADAVAIVVLVLLWLLFFWRLFTPTPADQLSLAHGDFSRQFVTFGAYQHERFSAGEIPLWNPYNNGGLPFLADTQAAVFYPPRLLTIALSGSDWTYNALQMEMTVHVLLYTLLMYAFVRRLTMGRAGSVAGAFVAAIVAGYGGFMTGYPPLQLALLEAAIWLPLALLAVLEATRDRFRWPWLALAGLALGLTWLAGHPQTGWFATYALVGYLAWRVVTQRLGWRVFAVALAITGALTVGLAAVALLPGLEYLTRTARTGLSFDDKGGGFPFHDVAQMFVPGVVSLWSPLYAGITGLALALIGLTQRARGGLFWGIVALLALGVSFGGRTPLFHALYYLLPGLSFFRGQERAAYLVANSLAILAGLGVVALAGVNAASGLCAGCGDRWPAWC